MNNKAQHTMMVGLRPRPQRVAFLVKRKPSIDTLRKIALYCSAVWGGLRSIIVESDENSLREDSWALLKSFDPDLIYSFSQISDEFNIKLNEQIFPTRIIADENSFFSRRGTFNVGISGIVNQIFESLEDDLEYVTQISVTEDDECYDEILFNFGLYNFKSDLAIDKDLRSAVVESISAQSFDDLFTFDGRFPFTREWIALENSSPLHLSMRNTSPYFSPTPNREIFIFIYHTTSDILNFWNARALNYPKIYQNSIWKLVSDKLIKKSSRQENPLISKWINQKLSQNNVISPGSMVKFVLPNKSKILEKSISVISTNLNKKIKTINIYDSWVFYSKRFLSSGNFTRTSIHFFNGQATVENPIPDFLKESWGQPWCLDIEMKEITTGQNPINLPRFQGIPDLFLVENKGRKKYIFKYRNKCRIDKEGYLSLLVEKLTKHIVISIPTESDIFDKIIRNEKSPNAFGKGRAGEKASIRKGYVHFEISDKGELNRGIENIFQGLDRAAIFLKTKEWRDCFSQMAKGISQELEMSTLNLIQKTLHGHLSIASEKVPLSQSIFEKTISKLQLPARSSVFFSIIDLPFSLIEGRIDKKLIEVIQDDLKNNRYKEAFRNLEILSGKAFNQPGYLVPSTLIGLGVLQSGFLLKCMYCGSKYWYPVRELGADFTCRGCLRLQSIPINPTWKYKLNELVSNGLENQGAIPPILTLAQIKKFSKNTFIPLHEQYLYTKYTTNEKQNVEVDILCIVDGRLIVGECKKSSRQFTLEEINKLSEIAERIDADEIIFSSMDPVLDLNALKLIEELKESLKDKRDVQIMMLTNLYKSNANSKYVHVPECPYYNRISEKELIKYYEWNQILIHDKIICKPCYKASEKMQQKWLYWPYPNQFPN